MPQAIAIVFHVFGGLGIFLLGMKNMSEGMQAVAGDRMRKLIGLATDNRLIGIGAGATVTGLIQSSSVATVMVVGMVNAGLMTLKQAIGIIVGANIGTTITAWIMAYSLEQYGLSIIGISALFYLFSKSDRVRFIAVFVLGLGMVFFGLELMKQGLTPIRSMPEFVAWFSRFQADSYWGIVKCIMVGAAVTAVIQSSSATVGITMALAGTGIIDFPTAAGLVLGENIGTTITPVLASLGTITNAKRAAYAHVIFNILGVLWITPLFFIYIKGVTWFIITFLGCKMPDVPVYTDITVTYPYAEKAIAVTHTGFKILNMLVFLPWVGTYTRFLTWLVPEKPAEKPRLTYLNIRMLDTPAIAVEQAYKELLKMGRDAMDMMRDFKAMLSNAEPNRLTAEQLFAKETELDVIQKEIVEFIGNMMAGNITHEIMQEASGHLRIADELESISDYVQGLLKLRLKMRNTGLRFSEGGLQDMIALHDKVEEYLQRLNDGLAHKDDTPEYFSEMMTKGLAVTNFMKECRERHLARVGKGITDPLMSLIYTDMLTAYRRIKDHGFNIAEVLAGEK
jgi:phosphate:Na+ symporter